MGGRSGKNRALDDPFYGGMPPPPGPYPPGVDPSGGLGAYDPYAEPGLTYSPGGGIESMYGSLTTLQPQNLGGRYAQGFNQMPGISPWNYGNYYLGNTTMQIMPFMLNKVAKFGQIQALSALANAGLLGPGAMMSPLSIMPSLPMVPSMPAMPSIPAVPSMPVMPCMPSMPMVPSMPVMPCMPSMPMVPSMPVMPCMPSMPMAPSMSMAPSMPMVPSMPVMPCMPMAPSMPMTSYSMPSSFSMPMAPSMPLAPSMSMAPSMPMMSYSMPSSFSMSMAAPMMAAATPLPVAFNPLVQGMYPPASTSPVNWMTPSSFMSALTSGPMPYRPPAFDFPNNVGMVMAIPYGTPNPLLSSAGYGSSYNSGLGSSWCSWSYPMPPTTTPAYPMISYYPQSYPPACPVACPVAAPVSSGLPFIHKITLPLSGSAGTTTMRAGYNRPLPARREAPLLTSQGAVTDVGLMEPAVMALNSSSSTSKIITNQSTKGSLPVYDAKDQSQLLIGRKLTSSQSNLAVNNNERPGITPSKLKYRNKSRQGHDTISNRLRRHLPSISHFNFNLASSQPRSEPVLPPILNGYLISDSGWLPKASSSYTISSLFGNKKRKRLTYTIDNSTSVVPSTNTHISFVPRRRHKSNSSASEYDCVICQQQREKHRLREHFDSSTVSSLLSTSKGYSPTSFKPGNHKSHRRHPTRIKHDTKTPSTSSKKSNSPILLRQSPILEQRQHGTIHEVTENDMEEQEIENNFVDDDDDDDYIDDTNVAKLDHDESQTSLRSIDE
ncbi:unnamed protein product [Rotaria sp. Silwood2]|nr:unnamed protein product [Rotaria sp. Silwood2]